MFDVISWDTNFSPGKLDSGTMEELDKVGFNMIILSFVIMSFSLLVYTFIIVVK